jgi:ribonuclease-3
LRSSGGFRTRQNLLNKTVIRWIDKFFRRTPTQAITAQFPAFASIGNGEVLVEEKKFQRETPVEFARRLSLPFKDFLLLSRALTHRSYLNEHTDAVEDNERLDFLGDAVLDFIVGAWLYNRYPEMPEGDLTRMRSALVYNDQLAVFGRQIQLGNAMRLGRGEAQAGGRDRSTLLCDTFEAVIGALYLDAGIEAVLDFVCPLLDVAAEEILISRKAEDPKSMFQEWSQSEGHGAPKYVIRSVDGPDHSRTFAVDAVAGDQVYGSGHGASKQTAAKAAARDALIKLGRLSA